MQRKIEFFKVAFSNSCHFDRREFRKDRLSRVKFQQDMISFLFKCMNIKRCLIRSKYDRFLLTFSLNNQIVLYDNSIFKLIFESNFEQHFEFDIKFRTEFDVTIMICFCCFVERRDWRSQFHLKLSTDAYCILEKFRTVRRFKDDDKSKCQATEDDVTAEISHNFDRLYIKLSIIRRDFSTLQLSSFSSFLCFRLLLRAQLLSQFLTQTNILQLSSSSCNQCFHDLNF